MTDQLPTMTLKKAPKQAEFDLTIGQLDRLLSKLVTWGKGCDDLDSYNRQTLKHHAEDMQAAAEKILSCLGEIEGTPQPRQLLMESAEFNWIDATGVKLWSKAEQDESGRAVEFDGSSRHLEGWLMRKGIRPGSVVIGIGGRQLADTHEDNPGLLVHNGRSMGRVDYPTGHVGITYPPDLAPPGPGTHVICDFEFKDTGE